MRRRGQALVEFALVAMLMFVIVFGIVDFGYLFASRVNAYAATRTAARYAATHPTAWTNAASPAAATIEGQLNLTNLQPKVPNDDSHITIGYYVPGSAGATLCGSYSASSNSFVAQSGYTQATCVVAGDLVRVRATYVYGFITPLLRSTFPPVTISTDATAMVEV
jgi:Flp pilus assembly protein TadG